MAKCMVCGAPHKSCGPPSAPLIAIPYDIKPEGANVALHEYRQQIGGTNTTVLLSDEDAKLAGLTKADRVESTTKPKPEAPAPADAEDVGEDVAQLTAEEVAAVRELIAARTEGADVNSTEQTDETAAKAAESTGTKESKAPANKAVSAPNKAATDTAATK